MVKEKYIRKPEDEEIDLERRRRRRERDDDEEEEEEEEDEEAIVQCLSRRNRKSSECVRKERGQGAKTKGWPPLSPDGHPRRWWLCCRRARSGGGTASRQSSLRAFQDMARAFEVAGFRRGIAGTKGDIYLRGREEGEWGERRY